MNYKPGTLIQWNGGSFSDIGMVVAVQDDYYYKIRMPSGNFLMLTDEFLTTEFKILHAIV